MVSAQIGGTLRFYRIKQNGGKELLWAQSDRQLGTGGSSEGTPAQTQEKWPILPAQQQALQILNPTERLEVTFQADAAATTDASDCFWSVPLSLPGGVVGEVLNGPSDTVTWDDKVLGDIAFVAGQEATVCRKKINQVCVLGSNVVRAFASIENNA